MELTPDLGGAWTELRDGVEVIRFGYSRHSPHRWFQIFDDPGKRHHVLTIALERIVFARAIQVVQYGDATLLPMLRRALRQHPAVRLEQLPAGATSP
jgi:hypothetical protein